MIFAGIVVQLKKGSHKGKILISTIIGGVIGRIIGNKTSRQSEIQKAKQLRTKYFEDKEIIKTIK